MTEWCAVFWSPWRCLAGGQRRRNCYSDPELTQTYTRPGKGRTERKKNTISFQIWPIPSDITCWVFKESGILHCLWKPLPASISGTSHQWCLIWSCENTRMIYLIFFIVLNAAAIIWHTLKYFFQTLQMNWLGCFAEQKRVWLVK